MTAREVEPQLELCNALLITTPAEAESIGENWPLPPGEWANQGGFGLLLCKDSDGQKFRYLVSLDYARLLIEADRADVLDDIELPRNKFPLRRDGWPDLTNWNIEGLN